MILTLGAWHITLMAIGFVVVSLFMLMVVLIQRPKGGGLAGAFGGVGGTTTAFGAKTGDILTIITVVGFVLFLALAIGLNLAMIREHERAPSIIGPVPDETTETTVDTDAGDAQKVPVGGVGDKSVTIDDEAGTSTSAPADTPVQSAPAQDAAGAADDTQDP